MDRAASAPDSVWDANGMASNINALLASTMAMETHANGTIAPTGTSSPVPTSLTSRFADLFLDLDRIERGVQNSYSRSPQAFSARDHHHTGPHHGQKVTSAVLTPEYDRPATVQLNRQEFDRVKMNVKVLSEQLVEVHEVLRKLVPFLHQILVMQKSSERTQGSDSNAILEKLHPYIEQNLSNHLRNIQNHVLNNMNTLIESQENKFAELNNQISLLTNAMASRDQEVVNNLSQMGEVMSKQQAVFESKIEELRTEFTAKFQKMEYSQNKASNRTEEM
eukprot:TRINITY_DN1510_c0_g1_i1.p1 TRINITY_DN1510_c0_g1~~TRINITY_DN1510_c0_g1_i1.p1  ORF type:complete len:324 (-),score=11.46 TRINITY_DN1510_c0_g1_i1:512-1345(-)